MHLSGSVSVPNRTHMHVICGMWQPTKSEMIIKKKKGGGGVWNNLIHLWREQDKDDVMANI